MSVDGQLFLIGPHWPWVIPLWILRSKNIPKSFPSDRSALFYFIHLSDFSYIQMSGLFCLYATEVWLPSPIELCWWQYLTKNDKTSLIHHSYLSPHSLPAIHAPCQKVPFQSIFGITHLSSVPCFHLLYKGQASGSLILSWATFQLVVLFAISLFSCYSSYRLISLKFPLSLSVCCSHY